MHHYNTIIDIIDLIHIIALVGCDKVCMAKCQHKVCAMDAHQLGKTTASVSSNYIIIEALGGPSAGPRFKEISIWFESRISIGIMRNAQWA